MSDAAARLFAVCLACSLLTRRRGSWVGPTSLCPCRCFRTLLPEGGDEDGHGEGESEAPPGYQVLLLVNALPDADSESRRARIRLGAGQDDG